MRGFDDEEEKVRRWKGRRRGCVRIAEERVVERVAMSVRRQRGFDGEEEER